MTPQRIQRKRTRGYRLPENAVYVGRPTKWGNLFRVGGLFRTPGPWGGPASPYHGVHGEGVYTDFTIQRVRDEAHAVDLFGPYVRHHDDMWPPEMIRAELGGKDLACWCRLDRPCHADVLLAIAAGGDA